MKTALITGGAGFIGSHLCDLLIGEGYRVFCMDNLITGEMRNIAHLLNVSRFEFIKHNVCEHITMRGRIGYCLHFASPASPVDYLKFPIQTLKVGSLGTHNTLGLAKSKNAVFLLASTSEIYGDPLRHPQDEEYWGNVNCVGPRGVYDEAKRFAESLTMAYHRTHKMDTKIVRIFNTFGPRMRKNDGRAIPNFISQALNNKPVTVFGRGVQTRSFCYISDLINGIHRAMCSNVNLPINIGNPDEMTVLELAKRIIELTGSRSRLIFRPLPLDDPKVRQPDIRRARRALRWQPRVDLDEGLKKTIEYFRQGKNGVDSIFQNKFKSGTHPISLEGTHPNWDVSPSEDTFL